VSGRGRMAPLVLSWVVLTVAVVAAGAGPTQLLAIGVSGLLVAASRWPSIGRALSVRPLIFLGGMSYSLYLYHSSVGWRFVSLIQRVAPGAWSSTTAIAVYLIGIVFAVAFSMVLWRLVERPCLDFCQRIKLPLKARPAVEPSPDRPPVAVAVP